MWKLWQVFRQDDPDMGLGSGVSINDIGTCRSLERLLEAKGSGGDGGIWWWCRVYEWWGARNCAMVQKCVVIVMRWCGCRISQILVLNGFISFHFPPYYSIQCVGWVYCAHHL